MDEQGTRVRHVATIEHEDLSTGAIAEGAALHELLPTAIALLDPDGVIRETNTAWRRDARLGAALTAGGIGRRYAAVLRDHGAAEVVARVQGAAPGARTASEVFAWHDDGAERWLSVEATRLAGDAVIVEHRDATEAQRALRRALIASRLASLDHTLDRAPETLGWLCDVMGWELAAVWSAESFGAALALTAVVTPAAREARACAPIRTADGAAARAWRARAVGWSAPTERGERAMLREALRARAGAVRSVLALPTPLGALTFYATHQRRPDAALEALLAARTDIACAAPDAEACVAALARPRSLRGPVSLAAMSLAPVLLTGEAHTGKSTLAEEIHRRSERSDGPLVRVDCRDADALARLAGVERREGAAREVLPGAASRARGGTLVLEHIDALDPEAQAWLREAMTRGRAARVGGVEAPPFDARVIACSRVGLGALREDAGFDDVLLDRLAVLSIEVPPLRARAWEVVELARAVLDEVARAWSRPPPRFDDDVARALVAHPWPDNLRELRAVLERAWHGVGDTITAASITAAMRAQTWRAAPEAAPANTGSARLSAHERAHVERVLRQSGFKISRTARELGISRSTLYARIHAWGIDLDAMRTAW